AHGLIADCTFVGLPGNVSFFQEKGNLRGFDELQKLALDLAVNQGYAKTRTGFFQPQFDFDKLATLGKLTATPSVRQPRIDSEVSTPGDFDTKNLDERTIVAFTINFEPNQDTFSAEVYGADFQKALEAISTYGNTVLSIRGHADPTKVLSDLVRAGMTKGVLQ